MKKTLGFVSAVFLTLLGSYYAYYLARTTPDVRYRLTEKISVDFANPDQKSTESVQLLEVSNSGNAEAKRVQVVVNGEVTKYAIDKYSESDAPQSFNQKSSFELIYPELPSQGIFKLRFTSPGRGVDQGAVVVRHNGGRATDALSGQGQSALVGWLAFLIPIAINLPFFIYLNRGDLKAIRLSNKNIEHALNHSKPWYFSQKGWQKTWREVLHSKLRWDYPEPVSIQQSDSYKVLASDKPAEMDDVDWQEIVKRAKGNVEKSFAYPNESSLSYIHLLLLRVPRPKQITEGAWRELQDYPIRRYLELREPRFLSASSVLDAIQQPKPDEIPDHLWSKSTEALQQKYVSTLLYEDRSDSRYFPEEAVKKLKAVKPPVIPDEIWEKHTQEMQRRYYEALLYRMSMLSASKDAIEFLEPYDLGVLNDENQGDLKRRARQIERDKYARDLHSTPERASKVLANGRPMWMTEEDYQAAKTQIEAAARLQEQVTHYQEKLKLLNLVLADKNLPVEKPENVNTAEWNELKLLEQQVQSFKLNDEEAQAQVKRNVDERKQLIDEKALYAERKELIEQQLKIVHEVLCDPSAVERIENYSDVFASGNFRNLKRVAELLSASAQEDESKRLVETMR